MNPAEANNKQACVKYGQKKEREFLELIRHQGIDIYGISLLGLKYEPDFQQYGKLAELKTQETPFFMAQERYGLDPQYCVSFNRYDYERYSADYPGLLIYFWVKWETLEAHIGQRTFVLRPLHGIWLLTAERMHLLVGKAKEHFYKERGGQNKKSSFGLDLREMDMIWLEGVRRPIPIFKTQHSFF